jgi:hypothetical protein
MFRLTCLIRPSHFSFKAFNQSINQSADMAMHAYDTIRKSGKKQRRHRFLCQHELSEFRFEQEREREQREQSEHDAPQMWWLNCSGCDVCGVRYVHCEYYCGCTDIIWTESGFRHGRRLNWTRTLADFIVTADKSTGTMPSVVREKLDGDTEGSSADRDETGSVSSWEVLDDDDDSFHLINLRGSEAMVPVLKLQPTKTTSFSATSPPSGDSR